jgi:hypothetical protein
LTNLDGLRTVPYMKLTNNSNANGEVTGSSPVGSTLLHDKKAESASVQPERIDLLNDHSCFLLR